MRNLRRYATALLLVPLLTTLLACAGQEGVPLDEGALRIEPEGADIAPGESVRFTAIGDGPVEWTVLEEGGGRVEADGTYTAPDAAGTYHVIARTAGALTAQAQVRVAQQNAGPVAITPRAASVAAGATLTFQAAATGADARVTWSVAEGEAGGAITTAGVYTAPAAAGVYHVVATSVADARATATATVTVTPAVPTEPTIPTEPTVPTGPQLYVATDGDDANPGTESRPWRTIQKAMNAATPGSTVNIRGGTYRERLVMNVSGTADAPITFQPYGFVGNDRCGGSTGVACAGEKVVLDYAHLGVVGDSTPALKITDRKHLVIQGLAFQNFSNTGVNGYGLRIDGTSDNVKFRWVRVERFKNVNAGFRNGALSVVRILRANAVQFSNCQFYDNVSNWSEVLDFDDHATNGLVEKSHFRGTDGIACSTYRGSSYFTFRYNRFEWVALKPDGSRWYNQDAPALYNDGGHHGLIEGNVVVDSAIGVQSLGEIENGLVQDPVHHVTIRNNVFLRNRMAIVLGTWYSSTDGSSVREHDVYNNTIYRSDIGIYVRPFTAATTRVRNNVISKSGVAVANALGWNVGSSFDYNLYDGGGRGPDVHQVNADPMFANPDAEDFTLRSGSPAIGAGDPTTAAASVGAIDVLGGPRIVGDRIDLGAVEMR